MSEEERAEAEKNNYNFDHPDAFDTELLVKTLTKLKAGKRVEIPIYNFKVGRGFRIGGGGGVGGGEEEVEVEDEEDNK